MVILFYIYSHLILFFCIVENFIAQHMVIFIKVFVFDWEFNSQYVFAAGFTVTIRALYMAV